MNKEQRFTPKYWMYYYKPTGRYLVKTASKNADGARDSFYFHYPLLSRQYADADPPAQNMLVSVEMLDCIESAENPSSAYWVIHSPQTDDVLAYTLAATPDGALSPMLRKRNLFPCDSWDYLAQLTKEGLAFSPVELKLVKL